MMLLMIARRGGKVKAAEFGRPPGSGLGLAIVKYIVEAHDGNVEVSSQPGRGTSRSPIQPGFGMSGHVHDGSDGHTHSDADRDSDRYPYGYTD